MTDPVGRDSVPNVSDMNVSDMTDSSGMEEDLVGLLRGDAGVAAIAQARVYLTDLPQGSGAPAVIVHVFHNEGEYDDRGPIGLASALAQIDCLAEKAVTARGLGRAVERLLSGFSGAAGTTDFRAVWLDGSRDDREGGTNRPEYRFRRSLDFTVWHSARAPEAELKTDPETAKDTTDDGQDRT